MFWHSGVELNEQAQQQAYVGSRKFSNRKCFLCIQQKLAHLGNKSTYSCGNEMSSLDSDKWLVHTAGPEEDEPSANFWSTQRWHPVLVQHDSMWHYSHSHPRARWSSAVGSMCALAPCRHEHLAAWLLWEEATPLHWQQRCQCHMHVMRMRLSVISLLDCVCKFCFQGLEHYLSLLSREHLSPHHPRVLGQSHQMRLHATAGHATMHTKAGQTWDSNIDYHMWHHLNCKMESL